LPTRSFAPRETASFTRASKFFAAASAINGPISSESSIGSP
jgi:hypothetical protein